MQAICMRVHPSRHRPIMHCTRLREDGKLGSMKTITSAELQKVLATQPSLPVIDVRTPVEFTEVHVPEARNVPLDELKPGSLQLQKDQPVYLLCRSGGRATKAAEKFAKDGFAEGRLSSKAERLHGLKQNLPVTRSQTKVISLERGCGSLPDRSCSLAWRLAGLCIAAFLDCQHSSERAWFSPASRTFAGWDYCSPGCRGTNRHLIESVSPLRTAKPAFKGRCLKTLGINRLPGCQAMLAEGRLFDAS